MVVTAYRGESHITGSYHGSLAHTHLTEGRVSATPGKQGKEKLKREANLAKTMHTRANPSVFKSPLRQSLSAEP